MAMNKRIIKEYTDATAASNVAALQGTKISMPDEQNMLIWQARMPGPPESAYAGGNFVLKIELPPNYPFKPPKITFETKIYHPNVTNDSPGLVCLAMLRGEEWKPPNKIVEVLARIRELLGKPDPDDAVETSIAEQYKSNRSAFTATAKEYVAKYAKSTT